ncbi:hypothetical protein H0H93_002783 [Arthromyces matolae]|nr:hypothetical protein H0H93_002783 [Arthromyces matolae]
MENLAVLTQSHKAIAAKKKAKREQIKEVVFDEDARREFLTGFHKRKVAKADAARKKAMEREKRERQETRREQRRMLREQAAQNASEVESAYRVFRDDSSAQDEWSGIGTSQVKQNEEEYEDEEVTAIVTVVEDFGPEMSLHGPHPPVDTKTIQDSKPASSTPLANTAPARSAPKKTPKQKVRYQTKEERKRERRKQHGRRTEKAELAGGRASRKKGAAQKRKGGSKR